MQSSRAHLLLESLQENTYRRLGRLEEFERRNHGISERVAQNIEALLDTLSDTMPPEEINRIREEYIRKLYGDIFQGIPLELPTRYENRHTYSILYTLSKEIEQVAVDIGHTVPLSLPVGTLPTGQVNAVALRISDSGEYLILFDDGLPTFALLMSKAVTRAFPLKEDDGESGNVILLGEESWKYEILNNPAVLQRFQEVLVAYLFDGNPGYAPQYYPEEPWAQFANMLRSSMELFIVGHEYAHIIEGHLEANPHNFKTIFSELTEDEGVHNILRSWDMEFRADFRGSELSMQVAQRRGYGFSLSYCGADFFFTCISVVEEGVALLGSEQQEKGGASESHPPTNARRKMLRDFMRSQAKNEHDQEVIEAAIELGTTLEDVVAYLWEHTKPLLLRMRNEGRRLSPIWDGLELQYPSAALLDSTTRPQ